MSQCSLDNYQLSDLPNIDVVNLSGSDITINKEEINRVLSLVTSDLNNQLPDFLSCNIDKYANNIKFKNLNIIIQILICCILIIPLIQIILTIYFIKKNSM